LEHLKAIATSKKDYFSEKKGTSQLDLFHFNFLWFIYYFLIWHFQNWNSGAISREKLLHLNSSVRQMKQLI
jgi:hypothetical protein